MTREQAEQMLASIRNSTTKERPTYYDFLRVEIDDDTQEAIVYFQSKAGFLGYTKFSLSEVAK